MSFPSITKTSLPGQQHSDLEWDVVCVCSGFICLPKVWVDLRNGFDLNAQIAIGSCSFKTVVNVGIF